MPPALKDVWDSRENSWKTAMGPLQTETTTHSDEKLRCAKCRKNGTATWENMGEPASAARPARARNRLRKLVGLSTGFKSVDRGGREGLVIACSGCGAAISSG